NLGLSRPPSAPNFLPSKPRLANFFSGPRGLPERPLPPPGPSRRPREALSLSLSRGMKVLTRIGVQDNDTRAGGGAFYAKRESTFAEGPCTSRFFWMIRGLKAPSFMDLALKTAENAGKSGEVPIGCVIVRDYEVIATAGNLTLTRRDPTAHAEVLAIREAAERIGTERLTDCDMYVTLEPCTMCAGAISFARIRRLYYGAADPKGGAVESGVRFFTSPTCHHVPDIYPGIGEHASATLLREFFRERR